MNILQIMHRLPYPLIDGGKKGIFAFLEGFATSKHNLHVICIAPEDEKTIDIAPLNGLCPNLRIFYRNVENSVLGLMRNTVFSDIPYNMEKYLFDEVQREINQVVVAYGIDVIHCDHLHMAAYAIRAKAHAPHLKIVLREHNVETTILERLWKGTNNPLKRILFMIQAKRLYKYEAKQAANFDLVLPISEIDRERLVTMCSSIESKILVVPAGTECYARNKYENNGPCSILHVAAMDWIPNQEAVDWFMARVFQRLVNSDIHFVLHLAGKNMPKRFWRYAGPNVVVHGFVEDIDALVDSCDIGIVPLHAGGGMRIKILDYMSRGVPVVSTTIGAEGISDGSDGTVAIADTAEEFAVKIEQLMRHPMRRKVMADLAQLLIKNKFGQRNIMDKVIAKYEEICACE